MFEIMTARHKSWLLKFVDGNFMNILQGICLLSLPIFFLSKTS